MARGRPRARDDGGDLFPGGLLIWVPIVLSLIAGEARRGRQGARCEGTRPGGGRPSAPPTATGPPPRNEMRASREQEQLSRALTIQGGLCEDFGETLPPRCTRPAAGLIAAWQSGCNPRPSYPPKQQHIHSTCSAVRLRHCVALQWHGGAQGAAGAGAGRPAGGSGDNKDKHITNLGCLFSCTLT